MTQFYWWFRFVSWGCCWSIVGQLLHFSKYGFLFLLWQPYMTYSAGTFMSSDRASLFAMSHNAPLEVIRDLTSGVLGVAGVDMLFGVSRRCAFGVDAHAAKASWYNDCNELLRGEYSLFRRTDGVWNMAIWNNPTLWLTCTPGIPYTCTSNQIVRYMFIEFIHK